MFQLYGGYCRHSSCGLRDMVLSLPTGSGFGSRVQFGANYLESWLWVCVAEGRLCGRGGGPFWARLAVNCHPLTNSWQTPGMREVWQWVIRTFSECREQLASSLHLASGRSKAGGSWPAIPHARALFAFSGCLFSGSHGIVSQVRHDDLSNWA